MADTGAPWNIPYVEPTDIPRTYPDDSEDLALAIAAGLSAAGNAGIGSNVVSAVEAGTFSTTSNTYVTLSGLTLSFTPTSASSKVLLMWSVPVSGLVNDTGRNNQMAPFRDGTNLLVPTSPGSRSIALMARNLNGLTAVVSELELYSGFFLDSPATTSAVTYDMRGRVNNAGITFLMNRTSSDTDNSTFARSVASLVAIEVAA